MCISTYYTGDFRRIGTLLRTNEQNQDLQRVDVIHVANAEVNIETDYEVNIIVTGALEALRGLAILEELNNAMEYPHVVFDDRRFINAITRSNGHTIINVNGMECDYESTLVDYKPNPRRMEA